MSNHLLRLDAAPVALAAAADPGKPRAFEAMAYTGVPMRLGGMPFPTVIDLAGLSVPRQDLPVLRDHDEDRIVGHTRAVAVSAAGVRVAGLVSGIGPDAAEVQGTAAGGFPWQMSVGAEVLPKGLEMVPAGKSATVNGRTVDGPVEVVRKSVLREVSFVPLGADGATSATVAARLNRESPVSFEQWLAAAGFDPAAVTDAQRTTLQAAFAADPQTADPVETGRRRAAAEADRIKAIDRAFGDRHPAARQKAIATGMTAEAADVEVARLNAYEDLKASYRDGPRVIPWNPAAGYSNASPGTPLAAAIMIRAGYEKAAEQAFGPGVMNGLGRLRSMSLMDLAAAALQMDGRDVPHSRPDMLRAAVSTGSLPVGLSEAANRVAVAAYAAEPATWRGFAAIKSAPDFRQQTGVRPSFFGDLSQIPDGGDIKHGTFSEETYSWQVDQYGKMLSIGRKQFINDDLSLFSEVLPSSVKAAGRTLNTLVWRTIMANAGSFFGAGNGNYISGAGTDLGVAGLAAALKKMRTQTDAEGNSLGLQPAVLAVPPELELTARQLLNSTLLQRTGDQAPTGNPFSQLVDLVIEPRLSNSGYTGYSTTAWYLFTGPSDAPVAVCFLDGQQTPTTTMFGFDDEADRLAISWRVVHDFGAALGDHRAAVKSAGA